MGRNGINKGLKTGWHQGIKSGMGHARMESGFKKGIVNEAGMHNKVQDPTLLQGSKKPTTFWLADYATATGAGSTVTALSELILGATTFLIGSSPAWQPPYRGDGGVYNNRAYIDFNSAADIIYTNSSTMGSGKNEFTLMMVFSISSNLNNKILFYSVDSTISSTIGDITVETMGGNRVRVTVIGSPTTTSSVYETYDATLEGNNWHILTIKVRLYQPNGPGSELEIWLNGRLNMNPITTTFGGSTSTFVGNTFVFGNNAPTSATAGGSKIAGALTLDYWANPSEQMRLENFFRWYYGRRF
jgi:hypothetical protein